MENFNELSIEQIIKDYEEKQKQIEQEGIESLSEPEREMFDKENDLFDQMRLSLDYAISGTGYMQYPDGTHQLESIINSKAFYSSIHNLTADNNRRLLDILYRGDEGRRIDVDNQINIYNNLDKVRDKLLSYRDVPIRAKDILETIEKNNLSMKPYGLDVEKFQEKYLLEHNDREVSEKELKEKSRQFVVEQSEVAFGRNTGDAHNTFIIEVIIAAKVAEKILQNDNKDKPEQKDINFAKNPEGKITETTQQEKTETVSKELKEKYEDEKPVEMTVVSKGEVVTNAQTAKQWAKVNQETQIGNSNDRILSGAVQQSTTDLNEANGNTYYVHEEQGDVEKQRGEPTKAEIKERDINDKQQNEPKAYERTDSHEDHSKADLGDKEVSTTKSSKTTTKGFER